MAKTRGAQNPSPQKLKFKDKLLGKGLNADALLKKLQDLHQNLAQLDQETVDQASLHSVRKELVNTSLLLHKDQGVKAYVACCLADILKLYAPDAPYTQNELRDIFDFFLKQLQKYLKGQDSPYYDQYFHLLESLATVKSIIIVVDLPDGDRMMVDYVRTMFLMVKRDLPPKLRMFMAEIIVSLILEASALPEELLDAIMAQFTAKDAVSAIRLHASESRGRRYAHTLTAPRAARVPNGRKRLPECARQTPTLRLQILHRPHRHIRS